MFTPAKRPGFISYNMPSSDNPGILRVKMEILFKLCAIKVCIYAQTVAFSSTAFDIVYSLLKWQYAALINLKVQKEQV